MRSVAGLYTFHFSDDLYGMYLTVKTVLRELDEMSDPPFQEEGYPSSYVLGEAAENDRRRGRQRRRAWTASDEEDANLADDDGASDDSFIVNDEEGEEGEQGEEVTAAFSDEEREEWEEHSDDEEAEEAAARRWRMQRRQRQANPRTGWTDEDQDAHIHDMTGSDGSDGEHSTAGNSVIELGSQDADGHGVAGEDADDDDEGLHHQQMTSARRRNNPNRVVIESDDDDDDDHDDDVPSAGGDREIGEEQKDDDEVDPERYSERAAIGDSRGDGVDEDGDEEGGGGDASSNDSPSALTTPYPNASNPAIRADNTEASDAAFSDADESTHPPSDSEVVRRPLKRRAGNVVLSDDEEEGVDGDDVDVSPANASKRLKTVSRPQFSDEENNEGDDENNLSNEDNDTKFARMHPWHDEEQDELHNAQQADAYEDEGREDIEHEYGDEPGEDQYSGDDQEENDNDPDDLRGNDGWDQGEGEDENRSGDENYGEDDEYGDGDDGWD